ncbi:Ltp family lipoprotein [Psychrobacter sp. Ps1]|uniref:Ltp family lipoprotein n=1 Tax=Psychrobacter sp. Ps1 TaxID=2790955 RepID=UPI001EDFBC54|nr:Ltp family lipoprotein [Psychrobacter sp. Ps1]
MLPEILNERQHFIYTIIFAVIAYLFIKNVAYPYAVDRYFKSEEFLAIKESISQHVQDCNDLNQHIQNLKLSYADIESFDYGKGNLSDTSRYNMKRKNWSESTNNRWTHPCSLSIVKNANDQPFKYLCKYFNIKPTEETLEKFENALNDFSAAEQGKVLLVQERDATIASVMESIPAFVMRSSEERIKQELGFMLVNLSQLYFPVYTFQYVSAGGNSSSRFDFRLDLDQLERFIGYLAELVKFENSVAGQRALMTAKLRERIKVRDNFTCKICSLSTSDEKNLLLEIDYITPLSKGGKSTEDNLQVLCWRCNRSKGSKTDHVPSLTHDQLVNNIPKPEVAARPAMPPTLPQNMPVSIAESFNEKPRAVTPKSSVSMVRPNTNTPPPIPHSHSLKATPDITTSASTAPQSPPTNDVFLTCFPDPVVAEAAQATPSNPTNITNAQKNAVRTAHSYLESSGFSRDGLIEQLEYDGYTGSDATIAVDSLDMNWIKQAKKTAKSYLQDSGFTRNGLIEQLEYDGYTSSDATTAVDSLNLSQSKSDKPEQSQTETVEFTPKNSADLTNPQKNAVRSAKDWLEYSAYSRKNLIETLSQSDGYTIRDATFAVDSLDINWAKQAKKAAKDWIEYSAYSRKNLIETLSQSDGYTIDDGTVAVDGLNVDWNEQALRSAKDWLEYSGYSRKNLIETLSQSDGYSQSQATYAAEKAGV